MAPKISDEDFDKLLKEALPVIDAMDAPPSPPPPEVLQRLEADRLKLVEESGKSVAVTELTRSQMRGLMLAVLNEQSADAADLFRRLSKAGFKLERSSGEGVLFGVLAELESAGLIVGDWRESGSRDVKYYRVTEEGEAKLQVADDQIAAWCKAVRVVE